MSGACRATQYWLLATNSYMVLLPKLLAGHCVSGGCSTVLKLQIAIYYDHGSTAIMFLSFQVTVSMVVSGVTMESVLHTPVTFVMGLSIAPMEAMRVSRSATQPPSIKNWGNCVRRCSLLSHQWRPLIHLISLKQDPLSLVCNTWLPGFHPEKKFWGGSFSLFKYLSFSLSLLFG